MWFDNQAEDAARHYVTIFKEDARFSDETAFGEAGHEHHKKKAGSVMTANFEIKGMRFTALNGGPLFKHSEAMSIVIEVEDQIEYDKYWYALTEGGSEQPCGWLKDKFGVSWQIVPSFIGKIMSDTDNEARERALRCLFTMKRLDLAKLKAAYGKTM